MTGVVKFFNDAKGYGFIVSDETKKIFLFILLESKVVDIEV